MLRERGMTSLELLQEVYCDTSKPWNLRIQAAHSALPYEHSKLPTIAQIETKSEFNVTVVDYRDLPRPQITARSVIEDIVVREMLEINDDEDEVPRIGGPKPPGAIL